MWLPAIKREAFCFQFNGFSWSKWHLWNHTCTNINGMYLNRCDKDVECWIEEPAIISEWRTIWTSIFQLPRKGRIREHRPINYTRKKWRRIHNSTIRNTASHHIHPWSSRTQPHFNFIWLSIDLAKMWPMHKIHIKLSVWCDGWSCYYVSIICVGST